jgi:hypothetical protein
LIFAATDELSIETRRNIRSTFEDQAWPEVLFIDNFDAGPAREPQSDG